MANTYDADLVVDRLSEQMILVLQHKLPFLGAFSRDFGADTLRPRATVQVEKSGTAATGQQNPTNYESGDTTNTNVAVTVNEQTQSFHVSSQELMQGHKLETKAENNLHEFANDLWDICLEVVTVANGYTQQILSAASWGTDTAGNRATMWALIEKGLTKHLIVDGATYSEMLPTNLESFNPAVNGAFGWDGIHHVSKWDASSKEPNCYGIACSPAAVAVASGVPVVSGPVLNQMESMRTVELPGLGLSVQVCLWGSSSSRATWASYGVMFGASPGDTTAAFPIVTA